MSIATEPRHVISDEEAAFFHENGYLVLRDALAPQERKVLSQAADALCATARPNTDDYAFGKGHRSGEPVLRRIDYVIDKDEAFRVLLGHPFVLRSVEKLQGPDFIPTWDAMVLKQPLEGIEVPWHRDARTDCVEDRPIFNVDFYLDDADRETCVWAVPGSQQWPAERANAFCKEIKTFDGIPGAVPVPVRAGDILLHNICMLHGSPPNVSPNRRRVIYYEFRPGSTEAAMGPHRPDYIPLKQQVLVDCLARRSRAAYVDSAEEPFVYQPPAPLNEWPAGEAPTFRYPHHKWFR